MRHNFLLDQFLLGANPLMFPFWLAGLVYYLTPARRKYRVFAWMYFVPLLLFILAQGRGYYLAPAYPMLLPAGLVWFEGWLARLKTWGAALVKGITYAAVGVGTIFIVALAMPVGPVTSAWWQFASSANSDLKEEIGWPELAQAAAQIRDGLPAEDQDQLSILTYNYGEAGAISMFGPTLGLPKAISGVNSYWLRGYGNPAPQTLIVIGYQKEYIVPYFERCELAGKIPNPNHLQNEESKVADVFVCRRLKQTWEEFWQAIRHFG